MEFGLREWLIIIGIVVILVILVDGWRRMQGGKNRLKLQVDRNLAELREDSPPPTETPDDGLLGPARVLQRTGRQHPDELALSALDMPAMSAIAMEEQGPAFGDLDSLDDAEHGQAAPATPARKPATASHDSSPENNSQLHSPAEIEEVLVINVIARDPSGFRGPALLQNILGSGLRFGEMDIFHRHESMTGQGETLFSMANAVKPGTFDLNDIDHFTTRAVSFFLGLPGPRHPKQAFDLMIAAARKLSQELNGELKDDQRSVLTAQTIENYRQRIAEFERRQMTLKR